MNWLDFRLIIVFINYLEIIFSVEIFLGIDHSINRTESFIKMNITLLRGWVHINEWIGRIIIPHKNENNILISLSHPFTY